MIIYICQDGVNPSGVATYGYHLLRHRPDARMLLLNADRFPPTAPAQEHGRITLVHEEESHNHRTVANAIQKLANEAQGPLILMPNTGDTPWLAVVEFLRAQSPKQLENIRVLGVVHSDMETQYNLARMYRAIAPTWMGVSQKISATLTRHIDSHQIHTLPYPVELPLEVPSRKEGGPLKLAYVGRLEEPQKKVSRLLAVFEHLREQNFDFSATIVGDGPEATHFAKGLKEKNLQGLVRMTGSLERGEIQEIMFCHDIFLLTSAFEGLPLALQEAMAAGMCPVVMAVESGLGELLQDGVNAKVVPQGDSQSMAAAIQQLSVNRPLLRKLAASAQAEVKKRYNPKDHFAGFARLFEKIVEQKTTPNPQAVEKDPTLAAVEQIVGEIPATQTGVVVYGSGMFGRKIVDECIEHGLAVRAIIDSDPKRAGLRYRGATCHPPEHMTDFANCVFAIGSLQFEAPIRQKIIDVFASANLAEPKIIASK